MNVGEFSAALHRGVAEESAAEHAAVDLLIGRDRWLNLLHEEVDVYAVWDESGPGQPQVRVDWTALGDRAKRREIEAMPADLAVVQAACSLASAYPVDLQKIALDADQAGLREILNAVAQAAGRPGLGPA